MPAITDLTFQQLESALGNQGAVSWNSTDGIVIRVGRITGDTYAGITTAGVVEFMHKLREGCAAAQSQVNSGQVIGERLAAFPPSIATAPIGGVVQVTQSVVSSVPLNLSQINGVNN